jgi:hypothetical protein
MKYNRQKTNNLYGISSHKYPMFITSFLSETMIIDWIQTYRKLSIHLSYWKKLSILTQLTFNPMQKFRNHSLSIIAQKNAYFNSYIHIRNSVPEHRLEVKISQHFLYYNSIYHPFVRLKFNKSNQWLSAHHQA